MKKTGLNGYVYEFNVDYRDIGKPDDITKNMLIIHNYVMLKYDIKLNVSVYLKSVFHRINNFIRFHKREFIECNSIELYFNE